MLLYRTTRPAANKCFYFFFFRSCSLYIIYIHFLSIEREREKRHYDAVRTQSNSRENLHVKNVYLMKAIPFIGDQLALMFLLALLTKLYNFFYSVPNGVSSSFFTLRYEIERSMQRMLDLLRKDPFIESRAWVVRFIRTDVCSHRRRGKKGFYTQKSLDVFSFLPFLL